MLSNYIEQLFKLDNYYDGLIVTDNKGYIEFFMTYRPDISGAKQEDLVGKHVLDIYPGLTEETSTIMRVLRSGEPIYNEYQTLITCREEVFQSVNTTMPIRAGGTGEIIGAIDVSRYASRFYEKQSINLHSAHTRKGPFYCVDDIITCSEDMEAIKRKIPLISKTDSTVLITGRSGTGKELIAQSIHTSSNRADKAFVSQNCAAIPATLLESILFGTTKGSYTGAENKPGLFEIANGGTLFLDEINSMDISVQPKLLRAIEEKRVCRLGSYKPLEVDVKIVAAMNEDPQECVRTMDCEARTAAGGVDDFVLGSGIHHLYTHINNIARCKVLPLFSLLRLAHQVFKGIVNHIQVIIEQLDILKRGNTDGKMRRREQNLAFLRKNTLPFPLGIIKQALNFLFQLIIRFAGIPEL